MAVSKWELGSFITDNEVQIITEDVRLVGYARGIDYSEALDRGLLMAAAPELLEACELWHEATRILARSATAPLSAIPGLQFEAQEKRKEAAAKGNAAIAKARRRF